MALEYGFELDDETLREEIELLGEVMAAAADAAERLPAPQLDEVLGAAVEPGSR